MIEVADKAVDLISKVDQIVTKKLDSHWNAVSGRPEDLVKAGAMDSIKRNMGKGNTQITYEKMRGFKGIEEFEPSGWRYESKTVSNKDQPDAESSQTYAYPMGAGYMMMSGCFGSNYKKGDPCYAALRKVSRCVNQIDSANFIGVGFDITKSYSAESRKKSVVQRTCVNKASFLGAEIPDNMNAYGIYDYSIRTKSFQSAEQYKEYLAKKSGAQMSSGVFRETSSSWQKTRSVGSAGLLYNVGGGKGVGGSAGVKTGVKVSNSLEQQMESQGSQSSTSFMALLEADMKLYEIALDHSTPEDLSAPFLTDFIDLPTSYYLIGADIKLQDFILRYGTHYVKSAKFGGQLNIFKRSKRNSKQTQDEFSVSAENEFSAMMSTLQNSYQQTHSKVNFFGTGGQSGSKNQNGKAEKTESSTASQSSTQAGNTAGKRSEFIETTLDVKGGSPEIAAAITDFYTPAFKSLFKKWLSSIRDYPKPYDMTFGRITELLDVNANSLFKEGNAKGGCFGTNLTKDAIGYFFVEDVTTKNGNDTIVSFKKKYCKYGNNKDKFLEDFKGKRLALEKAITFFIAEGRFSVSSFELKAGKRGCETETLRYLSSDLAQSHTWPKWEDIKIAPFKVFFTLPFDVLMFKRNLELEVRYVVSLLFPGYCTPQAGLRISTTGLGNIRLLDLLCRFKTKEPSLNCGQF